MSIPSAPHSDDPPRLPARLLRFGVPVLVASVLLTVLFVEQDQPRGDLHVVAPVLARPNHSVAVRAWFFEDQTGSMKTVPTRVSLVDHEGRVRVSDVALNPSNVAGMEGALHVPQAMSGPGVLRATAEVDGDSITVERAIEISAHGDPAKAEARPMTGFQAYRVDPIETLIPNEAPEHLDVRVVGGVCVPELPCTLLVRVGKPAAAIEFVPRVGVRASESRREPTEGIVSLELTVVGNEALIEIVALGPSGVAAKRRLRLPVLSGGMVASLGERAFFADETTTLRWTTLGSRPVVVDYFRDGVWAITQSFDAMVTEAQTPPLRPGRWRVQVRGDVFAQDHAASLAFVVSDRGAPGEHPDRPSADILPYELADQEQTVFAQPSATSSLSHRGSEVDARRTKWRLGGAIAISLLGLIVAGYLLAIGLRRTTGGPEAPAAAASARFWRVTLLALAVLLLFLLIAAIALWRGFI